MPQLLFIQGGGEYTHLKWDNHLAASLRHHLGPDYDVHYPRMPDEARPRFAAWKAAILAGLVRLGPKPILAGHSIGATILLHTLIQSPPARPPAGLFLIAAPFIGEGGWPSDEITPPAGLGAALPPDLPIHLYQGGADGTVPPGHADLYAAAMPRAVIRRLPGRDHQLNNDLAEVAADIRALTA